MLTAIHIFNEEAHTTILFAVFLLTAVGFMLDTNGNYGELVVVE
jgi:hypothetical protein